MKNFFSYSVLLLFSFFFFQSCEPSDDLPNEETETLDINPLANLEVIPYEVVEIPVNDPPGLVNDYELFFGDTEIIISHISSNGIEVVIPRDINVGIVDAVLNYKGENYKLGQVEVLDYNNYFPANLAYHFSDNEEYPLLLIDSAQTVIIPHLTDGRIDNVSFQFRDGTFSFLELNEDGLPKQLYSEKLKVIYDNYDLENSTVNIAYYTDDNTENVSFEYGVPLNQEMLDFLAQTRSSQSKQSNVPEMISSSLATSISLAACAASLATAPTGIGIALVVINCGSATYNAMKLINPNASNEIADKMQAYTGLQMGAIDCLSLPMNARPQNALELYSAVDGCSSFLLGGYETAKDTYINYLVEKELILKNLRAILASGYGDVKITLSWDTEADIDLWVTDPYSEKLWYENETSSSGGRLDVDNTEGYGPENVFWPENEAPFGTYIVQIHYYGPEDGPVTNCRVVIDNFGVQTVYNQALTPDGLVTIAIFEAGEQNPIQYSPEIVVFKNSAIPSKK